MHENADFDHTLYAQFPAGLFDGFEFWQESRQPAGMFVEAARCKGIVDEVSHAYVRVIRGLKKNEDILA